MKQTNIQPAELSPAKIAQQRRMFVGLALLFLAPVGLAFYMYYGNSHWRPAGQTNHGQLIAPAVPLPKVALTTPGSAAVAPEFLSGKWSLIYMDAGSCDSDCRKALYEIRQVRLSLNKDAERIQTVFLYTGACCEQPFFGTEHPGLIAANIDSPEGQRLLAAFPESATALQAGRVYISDPLGNLMMRYPPNDKPQGLREDLKRLLKLSHIG